MKLKRFFFMFILMAALVLTPNVMAEDTFPCFFRFDLNDAEAWQKPLSNVRYLTEGAWTLTPLAQEKCEEYGISPDTVPSTEGLDTLNISGSADFSEDQFRQLAGDLRAFAGDRQIWIVDCRLESHGLVNGICISWYGDHNWANKGLTLEEAEADEASRFGSLPGSTITVYTAKGNVQANPQEITVERTMSEQELVESEGFHYLRLAANDHSWPEEEAVDSFLSFVDELDRSAGLDNVWLHFHCHAGKSRTGIFMEIYDMIRNPSVSFDDIMLRHAMTGSSYIPYIEQGDLKDVYTLRAQRIRQVYDYLHSDQYRERQMSWSEWVAKDTAEEQAGNGQAEQTGEKRIFVAETTDVHGYIMDVSSGNKETFQYRLARIAQKINEARTSGAYDDVLLLDGGDLYQGTPTSLMTGGAVIRAALDAMHYDAVGLGNHEFDWEVTEYAADQEGTVAPYVLGDYFGDPKIPVLASNLYDAATGQRVAFTKDYAVVYKAGLRIALIGYIPEYSHSIMTSKISPYVIDADLTKLDTLVREVNAKENPDATVIIVHDNPIEVAEAMDPSQVNLVVGGHTNDILAETAKSGVAYIQGYYYANGFASAVLVIGDDGTVTVEDLNYTDIAEDKEKLYDTAENAASLDPEIMEISYAGWDAISEEMSEVLGYIDTPVLKEKKPGGCSAGNWITGLMLQITKPQGAAMAFYNIGGIRTSFAIPEGQTTREITVGDIYTIAPFGNYLLLFDLNGKELAQHLVNGLKVPNHGDQMSGLSFTYSATGDEDTPRNEREYTILSITLDDGTEVDIHDTETLYRVCTTNFSATIPGSVFEGKTPVISEADAPTDNEAFIQLLREEYAANDGYISVDTGLRGQEVRP